MSDSHQVSEVVSDSHWVSDAMSDRHQVSDVPLSNGGLQFCRTFNSHPLLGCFILDPRAI